MADSACLQSLPQHACNAGTCFHITTRPVMPSSQSPSWKLQPGCTCNESSTAAAVQSSVSGASALGAQAHTNPATLCDTGKMAICAMHWCSSSFRHRKLEWDATVDGWRMVNRMCSAALCFAAGLSGHRMPCSASALSHGQQLLRDVHRQVLVLIVCARGMTCRNEHAGEAVGALRWMDQEGGSGGSALQDAPELQVCSGVLRAPKDACSSLRCLPDQPFCGTDGSVSTCMLWLQYQVLCTGAQTCFQHACQVRLHHFAG
jgi:hypothetical protein